MYWVATGRTFILAGTEYVLCLAPLRGREPLTFFQIICLAGPFTEPPVASNLQSVASGGLYLINPLRLATASMMVFQRIRLLEIPSTVLIFLGNELDFVQTTQRQRSNSGQVPRAPPQKKVVPMFKYLTRTWMSTKMTMMFSRIVIQQSFRQLWRREKQGANQRMSPQVCSVVHVFWHSLVMLLIGYLHVCTASKPYPHTRSMLLFVLHKGRLQSS